jgi:plastocyanin
MKTKHSSSVKLSLVALFAIFIVAGCGSSNKSTNPNTNPPVSHSARYHQVNIQNMAFSPAALPIAVGDTVNWTNNAGVAHTVTSDVGNELSSGSIGSGQSYVHIFTAVGAFPYHCTIHITMHGAVTVQ